MGMLSADRCHAGMIFGNGSGPISQKKQFDSPADGKAWA